MLPAIKKLSDRYRHFDDWLIHQKIVLFSTLVIFALIPLTVFATISIRNLTSRAVILGSNTYGDCRVFGCTGPKLITDWNAAEFRVRYKCCFAADWIPSNSTWYNVGSNTSYTAPSSLPSGIFGWEVQIRIGGSWYSWQTGNQSGNSKSFSWTRPAYRAQLTHDTEFVNGCDKGLKGTLGRLENCIDFVSTSGTVGSFTGLSPNEYYDLFVSIRANQNTSPEYSHQIKNHIGPTGPCENCPVVPQPLPTKPNLTVNFVPSCLYPGQAYGSTLTFSWTGSGASKYAVDVSEWSNFSPGFTNKTAAGNVFSVSGGLNWTNQLYSSLAVNGSLSLQINKVYYARVYAESSGGYLYSDVKSIFVPICGLPPKPSGLNTGLSTFLACVPSSSTWGGQALFKWEGSGATSYGVDLADNSAFYPGFANRVISSNGSTGSFSVTGSAQWVNQVGTTYSVNGVLNLQPGKTYYWRVVARNNSGPTTSDVSTIFMPTCNSQAPSNPYLAGHSDLLTCTTNSTWGITHAFSWGGGQGAQTFWIDVSNSPTFASYVNKQLAGYVYATNGSGGWNDRGTGLTSNGNLNLLAGTNYYFRVFAWNSSGGKHSDISAPFTINRCPPETGPSPQNTFLPSPWQTKDIGDVGTAFAGAKFQPSTGVYQISGAGSDIWDTSDSFRYAWMYLNGNGQLSATIGSQVNTNSWAKAGIMIRESDSPSSKYAMLAITPSNGVAFQHRSETGGQSAHQWNGNVDDDRRPIRLVLTRNGSNLYGYLVDQSGAYQTIGNASITMNSRVMIGLAVTSHSYGSLSQASFSKVSGNSYNDFSKPMGQVSNLRVSNSSCSSDGRTATVKFAWDGPSELGANYVVDISPVQNPSTRWSSGSFYNNVNDTNIPRNGIEYLWGNIGANQVHSWRIWNVNTRTHTDGPRFVACQNQPAGSPNSGYISTNLGDSNEYTSYHRGTDIAEGGLSGLSNQVVYSTMPGKVIFAGTDSAGGGCGNYVDIYNPLMNINGASRSIVTRYCHFSSLYVSLNQSVQFGTALGVWGCTGTCSGTHVHYEVQVGTAGQVPSGDTSTLLNPLNFNIYLYPCVSGSCAYSLGI